MLMLRFGESEISLRLALSEFRSLIHNTLLHTRLHISFALLIVVFPNYTCI
jgi:hypothetical protein